MTKAKPIDAETLINTPLPPVRWLIPDLLPAGLAMLAGASKSGKSWMCLWICLQLAAGDTLWNRPIQPQTVLYFCLEDTCARVQTRLFKLAGDSVPSRLHFLTDCGGIGDRLETQIEQFLHTHPDTALVVIDTLQKVRTAEQNQSAYASDYPDMGVLKALADRHGICILLVHHLRKQGASDPFQQISGSNGLMGAADTIWLLQRNRMSPTARLLITGRDMESRTISLQSEDCVWRVIEEESDEEQAARTVPAYLWKIADFLTAAGDWQGTSTELLAAAGVADVQPNQMTRKLVEHFYTVFAPLGIRYESRRTASARLMLFRREAEHDGDDGHDGETAASPAVRGIAGTSSAPSQRPLDGNKHGLCVAKRAPLRRSRCRRYGANPKPRVLHGGKRMRKRAVGINVRVTAAEKRRMQAAARKCGLTLSEYLRQRALGYDPQPHPPKAVFAALETLDALADLLDPQSKAGCRTIADAIRDALLPGRSN